MISSWIYYSLLSTYAYIKVQHVHAASLHTEQSFSSWSVLQLLLIVVSRSSGLVPHWGCKLEHHGLFCCLPSLGFLYLSNLRFPGTSRCCDSDNTQPSEAVLDGDCVLHCMDSIKRWVVLMGIAVNCSLKAHFSISAGFQESSKNCYNTVRAALLLAKTVLEIITSLPISSYITAPRPTLFPSNRLWVMLTLLCLNKGAALVCSFSMLIWMLLYLG